ncbi:hypothetical protein LQ327_13980 [Actinomycetospora endophytica]|uniref:Uncharacterized protein n=1 Tax=Actinomycetospora endophytica TaxID=2291215 RepID=A0ABS8P8P6_9PSEU|nr:hypothetical protein [Actinomycetospora endophytica]MCD2194479.1 hypothetical protein [Actinomycetospora endophytica]
MPEMDRSGQRSPTELAGNHLVAGLLREGELTPNIAREVLDVVGDPKRLSFWERELNVYFLKFDFAHGVAFLVDDLDTSPDGTLEMSIDEMSGLLRDYIAREDD